MRGHKKHFGVQSLRIEAGAQREYAQEWCRERDAMLSTIASKKS